ncbi:putative ATP synthase subunit b', chloroplastic-like [Capsicum annuum]|nr:putative ATP synthase subunit b', chloroplastic-like [Capsicum annuum]
MDTILANLDGIAQEIAKANAGLDKLGSDMSTILERLETSNIMEQEDVSPKVSLKKNGSFICVAAPFLYDKLPEEPLKLSILKLDGSSFDIEVPRNGSVEDLKQAVVEAFSHCKISWLHVWGHFCLSYCGKNLLSDDDLIGTYGIKDGDESGKEDGIRLEWKRFKLSNPRA